MAEDEISNAFREKLEQDLNSYQTTTSQTLESFNHWSHHYSNQMQASLDAVDYMRLSDFSNRHQNLRNEAISQV